MPPKYGHPIWYIKDIELLEKVQRFALRICSRNYNLSYEELLDLFKIPSLQNRRSFLSLCTFYNIIRGFVFSPPHSLPLVSNSRTHHPSFYRTPFAHTSALQHSFMLFHCLITYHMMLQNLLLLIGLNTSYLLCFCDHCFII